MDLVVSKLYFVGTCVRIATEPWFGYCLVHKDYKTPSVRTRETSLVVTINSGTCHYRGDVTDIADHDGS